MPGNSLCKYADDTYLIIPSANEDRVGERRADLRESRLFDQFWDYLDTTRSDLKDAEQKARLELQLQYTEEKAAAVRLLLLLLQGNPG